VDAPPHGALTPVDVVGLGSNALDLLGVIDGHPLPDTKSPLRQFEVQGGGMIATAMVACARLGLRARYIGKFGDDYWARLGRRLLLRDGVDVRHALRRAGAQDGRELAVGLMTLDRLLGPTDGRTPAEMRATTTEALATFPTAAEWAEEFTRAMGAPRHVRGLTRGMVDASITIVSAASDADDALVAMLTDAVLTCQDLARARAAAVIDRSREATPERFDGRTPDTSSATSMAGAQG